MNEECILCDEPIGSESCYVERDEEGESSGQIHLHCGEKSHENYTSCFVCEKRIFTDKMMEEEVKSNDGWHTLYYHPSCFKYKSLPRSEMPTNRYPDKVPITAEEIICGLCDSVIDDYTYVLLKNEYGECQIHTSCHEDDECPVYCDVCNELLIEDVGVMEIEKPGKPTRYRHLTCHTKKNPTSPFSEIGKIMDDNELYGIEMETFSKDGIIRVSSDTDDEICEASELIRQKGFEKSNMYYDGGKHKFNVYLGENPLTDLLDSPVVIKLIKMHGPEVLEFVEEYGKVGLELLKKHGVEALEMIPEENPALTTAVLIAKFGPKVGTLVKKYGPAVIDYISDYGKEGVKYIAKYGEEGVDMLAEHGKAGLEMIPDKNPTINMINPSDEELKWAMALYYIASTDDDFNRFKWNDLPDFIQKIADESEESGDYEFDDDEDKVYFACEHWLETMWPTTNVINPKLSDDELKWALTMLNIRSQHPDDTVSDYYDWDELPDFIQKCCIDSKYDSEHEHDEDCVNEASDVWFLDYVFYGDSKKNPYPAVKEIVEDCFQSRLE